MKIFLRNEGKIKTFSDKGMLRELACWLFPIIIAIWLARIGEILNGMYLSFQLHRKHKQED
jgi:hypothetical protein